MTKAVLVGNNKGGTGKSTVATRLAKALRDSGHDIGLMDADIDSANLATRLGCDKKVEFTGDHVIKPVEHEGMKLYSMENAFEESTFSQSGQFMKKVINNMVTQSDWGELDYIVVDCPPGSSDVFDELITALRKNLVGAISVGQPDAADDTARFVKVCNHNWVPIIGFVENMSGMVIDGEVLEYDDEPVKPFGSDTIRELAVNLEGRFIGSIPLCLRSTKIEDYCSDVFDRMVGEIENSELAKMPENNEGNKSFIKNLWKIVKQGIEEMNNEYDISSIQGEYGVEDRDPLVMELKLTDAGPISSKVLSSIVLTVDGGEIQPTRKSKLRRRGMSVEAGMEISSQDLYDAIKGEKKVMKSTTGEVFTEPYSITKAVQMGDAQLWGERTVNRLAVLDKILTEVIDMADVREAVEN